MNIPEHIWRRADSFTARRNRNRLIHKDFILPAYGMQPQLMVRNPSVKGGWSPEIKTDA